MSTGILTWSPGGNGAVADQQVPTRAERSPADPATGGRLAFVDNLRVALTILVVLHHSALSFMGTDPVTVAVLTTFTLVNQAYFMGLFFLVSGYFVPASLRRKGVAVFLRDRVIRLLLPLVGYVVLLSPLTALDSTARADLSGPLWRFYLEHLSVGALWFLEVLLVLTVGYALVAALMTRVTGLPPGATPRRRPPPTAIATAGLILVIAFATYVVRVWLPFGSGLLNVPTPSHLPQYLCMFLVGTVAYRFDWFRQVSRRAGTAGFILAAVATVTLGPLALINTPAFLGGSWHWSSLAYALWESALCVGLALGLLALFRRRLDRQGRLGRYLSTHAFTVFLVHLPVIALLSSIQHLPAVPFLGFVVGGTLSLVLSFALAYPLRSLTPLRRIL